jgi:hypothetical protein
MRLSLCAALVALPFAAGPVAHAAPAPNAVDEEAVRKAADACLAALRKSDWKALAGQVHPESLAAFKKALTPALKRAAAPQVDKDGIPDFQSSTLLGLLEGADPKKLLPLPPREFFAALVQAMAPNMQRHLLAGMEAQFVGTVSEGRDLVHVLYRGKGKVRFADGTDDRGKEEVKKLKLVGEVTRLGVLTFKRSTKGWKVLVPEEVQLLADLLKAEWKEK